LGLGILGQKGEDAGLAATSLGQIVGFDEWIGGVMREEYSDRKLFLGMALSPQNSASPSSATSAMM